MEWQGAQVMLEKLWGQRTAGMSSARPKLTLEQVEALPTVLALVTSWQVLIALLDGTARLAENSLSAPQACISDGDQAHPSRGHICSTHISSLPTDPSSLGDNAPTSGTVKVSALFSCGK